MKAKELNTKELLQLASRSTQNALKLVANNNDFVEDLLKAMARDNATLSEENRKHRETATAENLDELQNIAEKMHEGRKALNRVSTDKTQRERIAEELDTLAYQRTDIAGHSRDMAKEDSRTLSDRQDCVQVWLLTYLYSTPSQKVVNSTVDMLAESHGDGIFLLMDMTLDEIWEQAKRRNAKNAVCNYVRNQKGLNALDTMKTRTAEPTTEELEQWLQTRALWERYPLKGTTTRALEIDTNGNYVFKDRYYTYRRNTTIETTNADGETIFVHTNNTLIHNRQDLEIFQALSNAEQLTERERRFVRLLVSRECIQAGETARATEYSRQYTEELEKAKAENRQPHFRPNLEKLDTETDNGKLAYCYSKIGIETDTTQRKFKSRLNAKVKDFAELVEEVTKATTSTPDPKQLEREYILHLMESNHGTHGERAERKADLLNWTNNAPRREPKAVAWITEPRETEKAKPWTIADPDRATAEQNANGYKAKHESDRPWTADTIEKLTPTERAKAERRQAERKALAEKMEKWENRHK